MLVNYIAGLFHPYAYESITIDDTVGGVGLSSSKYAEANEGKAKRVIMTIETQQVRYRTDGGAPTTSEGHILNSGDVLVLVGVAAIANFRAIKTGGSNGVGKCTFER